MTKRKPISVTATQPTPEKRRLSQREFEIWKVHAGFIYTSLVALITAFGAIGAAYASRVEYKMSSSDQVEVNNIAFEVEGLIQSYLATNDQSERDNLHAKLTHVAEAEANIMKKYNPNYRPRWSKPLHIRQLPIEPRDVQETWSPFGRVFFITLASIVFLSALSFYLVKWVLKLKPKPD